MADQKNTPAAGTPATQAQGDALAKLMAARDALTSQTAKHKQAEKDATFYNKKVVREADALKARQADFEAAEAEFRKPTAK